MSAAITAAVVGLGVAGYGAYSSHQQAKAGQKSMQYGQQLTQSAVAGLDTLDTQYQQALKAGLPADVRQTFAAQRGAITDEQARSNKAFATNLVQRAKATGGAVSEQAALDASVENQASTADAAFQARNQIAANEAALSLENTNSLLNMIEQVRLAKLGGGFNQQQIGSNLFSSGDAQVGQYASMLLQLAAKNNLLNSNTPQNPALGGH